MDDMLSISAIEPQKKKKDRYNIYSDGEYICSLGADSIVVFGIKEGMQISEAELKRAVNADNTQYAFDSAVNLLSFKMRTKKEMKDKLTEKKIDEDAIDKAIEKLESYGYIDDIKYASLFVESAVSEANYGKKVVEYKLKQRGISDEISARAMQIYTDEAEIEIAQRHYEALYAKYIKEEKNKRRTKIYSNLLRRGFSYDVISSVISEGNGFE